MAEYIDKSALVAEIEKLMDELYDKLPNASKVENGTVTASEICNTGKYTALESFRKYIDTIKVKEVDDVWHDVKEPPQFDRIVVFRYIDGMNSCQYCGQSMNRVIEWAYYDDLLKL